MLDRALFSLSLQLVALRIPARLCSELMHRLHDHVIARPRIKPITREPGGDPAMRLLLLREDVSDLQLSALPSALRELVKAHEAEPLFHTLQLDYSYFTADQVLRRLLPDGIEVPSAFEQVGHIAHVNLREEHLPFKQLIGQVLLDKNSPRIRTVVNKVESISNEFRVFPMEVIAGEDEFVTQVKENSAVFKLDYRQVYWNSRLEREHRRIVEMLRPSDVVCDMFAGIGPFTVPAALRGCRVYANDLNPDSTRWLKENVQVNKVRTRVHVSQLDGRDFVRRLLRPGCPDKSSAPASSAAASPAADTEGPSGLPFGEFAHVLMNLPASALEFLDVFVRAFHHGEWRGPLPRVHCYCFSKSDNPTADVIARAEEVLGCKLPDAHATIVRDVAPSKLMLCVSFVVPSEVAWATAESGALPEVKRQRIDGAAEAPPG